MSHVQPSSPTLDLDGLEEVYDALAEALDQVGPDKAPLMLTKLALLCAQALGDASCFRKQLTIAVQDLG